MKNLLRCILVVAVMVAIAGLSNSCAQRGRPSGGPIDSLPPRYLNSMPENYTTHFDGQSIRINFNEYIKLDDPQKQILISPPLPTRPFIKPQGQPLRYVEINFLDSLSPNTTYTINFGKSIVDNHEGNPLPFFKYVFSTGEAIDSLRLSGTVTNAWSRENDEFISVMLYRLDSTYTDSVVFQKPPAYVGYTKDETNTFTLENLKPGNYKIVAMKDENRNYKYDPRQDKIGFLTDTIHLPTDKSYRLKIFKALPDYRAMTPKQVSARHLLFGFEGGADSVQIRLLSPHPDDFRFVSYLRSNKDSIDYWFTPNLNRDSLYFKVTKENHVDTLLAVLQEKEKDSLQITAHPSSTLPLNGYFELTATTPLVKIDTNRIHIIDKDSARVPYDFHYKSTGNKYRFTFETRELQTYTITALPGALKDFYGAENDTLIFKLHTQPESDYANLTLTLKNIARYPVIVQLADKDNTTKFERIHHQKEGNIFHFAFLPPGKYYVRVIYDDNDNGIWDTGNYLQKRQPEKVIYMKKPLDVRQNWDISQTFTLKKPGE